MGDRFACHSPADIRRTVHDAGTPDRTPESEHDWIEAVAALDDCDGYIVLMVDPQTAEVDAHGPYGGPDATVAADSLKASLVSEGLGDVVVRIVRLHVPGRTA